MEYWAQSMTLGALQVLAVMMMMVVVVAIIF
jgi:hypothetical protein